MFDLQAALDLLTVVFNNYKVSHQDVSQCIDFNCNVHVLKKKLNSIHFMVHLLCRMANCGR